jgi:hypothetical protein
MDRETQAMRILAVFLQSKPGGEIKIHRDSLDKLDPNTQIECYQDGPLVCVRVHTSSEKKVAE